MSVMSPRDTQMAIEFTYSRKFIDGYIRQEIEANPDLMDKVREGVARLEHWMSQTYYESKNRRLEQLKTLDLEKLVMDCFVGVAYCQFPELFTSITAQLAGRLGFSDREDGIKTIAEIMAVLCMTDAFDILKENAQASLMIQCRFMLSDKLVGYIQQSAYLPPMVCVPQTIKHNRQSGYLTHDDSVILGPRNHHSKDVCLDVLNKQNQTPLRIDTDFLCTIEEDPTFEIDTTEKAKMWRNFKRKSYEFYLLMAKKTGTVHLTNKYDKRGRMYAQGYHISTQGTAFKKTMLEFAEQEVVEGVPSS
ncbi:hypothetical protein [Marinobacter shengliensis]|uniref:hypothetical protein n=1 Tax=Marinobacter shengliensis TaxID=1389223 RepID=UPI001E50979E|nr:hypothetical protein [Marinobacter shengliensis]MCD1628482.1 hypothetical protein [Marinobacter shengliensis]